METNDENLLADLLVRWHDEWEHGRDVPAEILCKDCLRLAPELARRIQDMKARLNKLSRLLDESIPVTRSAPLNPSGPHTPEGSSAIPPQTIGAYRVERKLGGGTFGIVYLGYDDALKRAVAIKVLRERHSSQADIDRFQEEARVLAGFTHPNIVPVFGFGVTDDGFPYFASQYIEGGDLATRILKARLSHQKVAAVIATMAEALNYAHGRKIYHRDIKPGNILIDTKDKPYLADFGLHLKRQDFGIGAKIVLGTPAYMSPEQARGEGGQVDGRTDIFSLGVVLYELLVGERPFEGESTSALLSQIISHNVLPPRQLDDTIPPRLEHICLKALRNLAPESYTTAADMADDLRRFLAPSPTAAAPATVQVLVSAAAPQPTLQVPDPAPLAPRVSTATFGSNTEGSPGSVMPKGLRSFNRDDAHFFLKLLPGPRDESGLPESVSFWKKQIEQTDPDHGFKVGVILGDSGSGKSSLVKAGILPRLSEKVIPVYLEATAEETETVLLTLLRKRWPTSHTQHSLMETLATVKGGLALSGTKLLIVLDQFEQWLHAKKGEQDTELVQALRICDGTTLQCLVMLRREFGPEVHRFLGELHVKLNEERNFAFIHPFPTDHAKNVLSMFGVALNKLPEPTRMSKEQEEFLNQAALGLAEDGRVICALLALFAEMMKWQPWTPETLKETADPKHFVFTFLEKTFSSQTNPTHWLHRQGAKAVLSALLPDPGVQIKGHMKSYSELLEASGYASRPREFDDLIRILDRETRLITPTDPEGEARSNDLTQPIFSGQKYYQLTHDYLVNDLRDWLTRKQQETRRGRVELMLAERASAWNRHEEYRQLPTLWEWLQILWYTQKKDRTKTQHRMMKSARKYYFSLIGLIVVFVLSLILTDRFGHVFPALLAVIGISLFAFFFLRTKRRQEENYNVAVASGLVDRLLNAHTPQVPAIIAEMKEFRRWIDPRLKEVYAESERQKDARKQLHVSLALLPVESEQVEYLYRRLLTAEPHEIGVIGEMLFPYRERLIRRLWTLFDAHTERIAANERFRAGCALALFDPDSERWNIIAESVVEQLVVVSPAFLRRWIDALRPVRTKLLGPLCKVFRERREDNVTERILAASIITDFASSQPDLLVGLLLDADEKQFAVLYPKVEAQRERAVTLLHEILASNVESQEMNEQKECLAKRQANAAVALLKLGRAENIWSLLKQRPDPRLRSYLIHRLALYGADACAIVKHLEEETDVTIQSALILSLGEFGDKEWPSSERQAVVIKLKEIYETADDPGIHAAAEWLLRRWQQHEWLMQMNNEWARSRKGKEGLLEVVKEDGSNGKPFWYINGQGHKMVVISGPVVFVMGSPGTEEGRQDFEPQHRKRIPRTFALAAKPVTVEQYRRYEPNFTLGGKQKHAPSPDCPVFTTSWCQAAAYCNWLSKEEGIEPDQWCYETDSLGQVVKMKEKYLSLAGYRLPTEAELEYGTRAGSVTSRYFGEVEELLTRYAWYIKNSQERAWPVGSLKPNDFGLFDVLGNILVWCQDRYREDGSTPNEESDDSEEDELMIVSTDRHILRGGSWYNRPQYVRSASRVHSMPSYLDHTYGFRVAKTITK